VCKHYLVNFCPNSLFTNTKADIGPCNLVHDDYLRKEYQTKATNREKRAFEDEFVRFCQHQLNEVDRKIKRAKQRLETSQMEKISQAGSMSMLSEENQEKLNNITERIEKLLEEVEQLGCEGKVEEAQNAMKSIDVLKEEKASIKRENQSGHWIQQKAEIGVNQEKQMEVCDVCGAFLIVNDVQQRVDDHLQGKQHVGYGRLKTALDEILEQRRQQDDRNRSERVHDRDRRDSRRDTGDRGRKRDFDRDRYRDRRDRDKKDRDKHHRSRTPDRKHKSKDRSRSRSRDRTRYGSNGTDK